MKVNLFTIFLNRITWRVLSHTNIHTHSMADNEPCKLRIYVYIYIGISSIEMINAHALNGNDHFIGNIMMAIQFAFFPCVYRTHSHTHTPHKWQCCSLAIYRSGAKSKLSPTNGPSSFKYKYKHQSKWNVLCFAFFVPFFLSSFHSKQPNAFVCLRVLLGLSFLRPSIIPFVYTKICLKSDCWKKRRKTNGTPAKRALCTAKWWRINFLPWFFSRSFHLTLKKNGRNRKKRTKQFQRSRYTSMMNDAAVYDGYLEKDAASERECDLDDIAWNR